jgi:hypothetical protein
MRKRGYIDEGFKYYHSMFKLLPKQLTQYEHEEYVIRIRVLKDKLHRSHPVPISAHDPHSPHKHCFTGKLDSLRESYEYADWSNPNKRMLLDVTCDWSYYESQHPELKVNPYQWLRTLLLYIASATTNKVYINNRLIHLPDYDWYAKYYEFTVPCKAPCWDKEMQSSEY